MPIHLNDIEMNAEWDERDGHGPNEGDPLDYDIDKLNGISSDDQYEDGHYAGEAGDLSSGKKKNENFTEDSDINNDHFDEHTNAAQINSNRMDLDFCE